MFYYTVFFYDLIAFDEFLVSTRCSSDSKVTNMSYDSMVCSFDRWRQTFHFNYPYRKSSKKG